ncbi:MAG: pyridoxamine 5'-phosphate oxidase family protein [Acidobacteria bacterium]|nr:pyridoxamine 5'-phosphate oxidase family protein [Acidobacteriota bacterium]
MKPVELLQFLRLHRWAVEASSSPDRTPQAALIGVAVTDAFEIVFDTILSTRKAHNLRANPAIALVIGGWGEDARTVQYEGIVDEPKGEELERLKAAYFKVFPEGPSRQALPGLMYFRARPAWIRYSDYNQRPPLVVEFSAATLGE